MDITLLESHKDYNHYNTHCRLMMVLCVAPIAIVIPKAQINDLYIVEDKRSLDMSVRFSNKAHYIFQSNEEIEKGAYFV